MTDQNEGVGVPEERKVGAVDGKQTHVRADLNKTWRDWLPDDAPEPADESLIDREELLRRLKARDIDMPARTLRHWESLGITPGPVRRWRNGATRSGYPWWAVDVVADVYGFRKNREAWSRGQHGPMTDADIARLARSFLTNLLRRENILRHPSFQGQFIDALAGLGRIVDANGDSSVASVDLTFRDQNGQTLFGMSITLSSTVTAAS